MAVDGQVQVPPYVNLGDEGWVGPCDSSW